MSRGRSQLGEEGFATAWAKGKAMSPGQAIEYALSDEREREPPTLIPQQHPPPDERKASLAENAKSRSSWRGGTNRRIASELSISEHTVANHVRKILKKMGLRSKAQIGFLPRAQNATHTNYTD